MATVLNTIPAEESDTLLTKKPAASLKFQAHMGAANASTKAKKVVGAVAAAALVLGVLAATSVTAGVAPTTASLSSKNDLPAPGWDTCRWVRSNSNTKGEHRVGYANSPWQCIAMVREFYPDATIANIEDPGAGGCWAQFGSEPTPQSDSDYKSCVLASMPPGSDLDEECRRRRGPRDGT